MKQNFFAIKAVLFDFDGTLTLPGAIDFLRIKEKIGCPVDSPILEFIDAIEDAASKANAHRVLDDLESEAARRSVPNDGAEEIVSFVRKSGLFVGIISRNSLSSIKTGLNNFQHIGPEDFDIIISRDDQVAPKPSGEGVLKAADALGVDAGEIILTGDFIFDIQAGRNAGATTVLLKNTVDSEKPDLQSDYTVSHLLELKQIIRMRLPLSAGKLPNDLLERYLEELFQDDPSVLIHPRVGEDTAAVDVSSEEVVVLKSDPITFATDAIGQYAVLINANDIATAGALPRWFLSTLLFPPGTTGAYIHSVMKELRSVCNRYHIALCGGHTEITDAVSRPVVVGTLAGTVAEADLIDKRRMRPGDRILLTKGISVEGTAIIAREFGARLAELGMAEDRIEQSRAFLERISILEEARLPDPAHVTGMHDVTEGGLATALEELSLAGGHRLEVEMARIPIFDQTAEICRLLGLHPLGLIASGSLLICCKSDHADTVIERIQSARIPVAEIGRVLEAGTGVAAYRNSRQVRWPKFEVDEITKLF